MSTSKRSLVKKMEAMLSNPTPFQEAVAEGVRISKAMQAAAKFGDARDEKLSAKAYLEEALYNGRTTISKLRKLDERLSVPGDSHPWIDRMVGNATSMMVATRVDQGCALRPPQGMLHTVLDVPATEFVRLLTETLTYSTTPLELVALAALRSTEKHPEAFGRIENYDEWMSNHDADYRAFRAACDRIRETASSADMCIVPVDVEKRLARVTYKWKEEDTGIFVFSPDAGADLVAWVARS